MGVIGIIIAAHWTHLAIRTGVPIIAGMCGIAGYIRTGGLFPTEVLADMLAGVRHRGPDGTKTWTCPANGLAFAHSRLKVLDLSDAAEQPMHSSDGTQTLLYNG